MEAIPELSEIWGVGWVEEGLFSTTYKIDVPLQFNSHVKEKITKHKPLRSDFRAAFFYLCLCWPSSPTGIKFWEQFQRQAWTKLFDSLRSDLITVSWQQLFVGNKL